VQLKLLSNGRYLPVQASEARFSAMAFGWHCASYVSP